jgi:hypothetical protein
MDSRIERLIAQEPTECAYCDKVLPAGTEVFGTDVGDACSYAHAENLLRHHAENDR